ncbi:MAG: polysaccharide deacetylase family protein [Clostridia bacterium]|nr:polysaccharide deacetylase family protein [Clostridia bacterium]
MFYETDNKLKAVTFSFDDGVTQDVRMIELLDRYGLKATFNLNSGLFGKRYRISLADDCFLNHHRLTADEIRAVYAGHEVAAHTCTHPLLTQLSDEEIVEQVENDRLALSELVGYEVQGMAYPCGGENHDARVAEIIRQNTGVRYCRTILSTHSFEWQTDRYRLHPSVHFRNFDSLMKLGNDFLVLQPHKPSVFYVWGHSYEMDIVPDYWEKLENFFRLISNQPDIYYGTNAEVFL